MTSQNEAREDLRAAMGGARRAGGLDAHNLALCILCAPALSLFAYVGWSLILDFPAAVAGLGADGVTVGDVFRVLLSYVWLTLLVVLWGLVPSILFGGAGCWLAERVLARRAWPFWGVAGLVAALAYVGASLGVRLLSPPLSMLIAPWLFRAEMAPDAAGPVTPWDSQLVFTIAGLLTGGFLSGLLYFRASRGGWRSIGADKRM